jgi:hypothetical protein
MASLQSKRQQSHRLRSRASPTRTASAYEFIGKERNAETKFGRLDTPDKVLAKAAYALDYQPEGTLTALLARSPKFGGKVGSVDDAAAKAIAGVTDVVQISNGVAVLATNFWAAKKGRDALKITWDDSAAETRSTDAMIADYKKLLAKPGLEARKEGTGAAGLKGAGEVITADFEFPYLVHAPMEPLNCVIAYKPGESCHDPLRIADADGRPGCGLRRSRPHAGTGDYHHPAGRRIVRPPRNAGCRPRLGSRADRQGRQRQGAGQADVDARGRHPLGQVSPDERPPHDRPHQQRRDRSLGRPHGDPVDHGRHPLPAAGNA